MARTNKKSDSTKEPKSKKTRVDKHDDALLGEVWQHFRDYLDSCDEDGNGDIDELQEIIELIGEVDPVLDLTSLKSRKSLLPVLASVAHGNLADSFLSQFLESKEAALELKIKEQFVECLRLFPFYASIWSILANTCRMQIIKTTTDHTPNIIAAYEKAAKCAIAVRDHALAVLDGDGSDEQLPEWIELLLLNQVVGVEWATDEDDDNEDAEDEENSNDDGGYWTHSEVEGTARFMAAMLLSTLGFHDVAKDHLKFFAVTHRLHPNLWNGTHNTKVDDSLSEEVVAFGKEKGNLLPESLYQRLCTVFAPEAPYWKESDYNNRGYYSYFLDIKETEKPSNLIEDIIVNNLLPLAKSELVKRHEDVQICGAEWWVHTRPIQANLGHNLHFDTDEAILAQNKEVTHPILSSVLYLTGGSHGGGATVVFDQAPDSKDVAPFAWKNEPRDNSFLLFPGNRLHGVLPCAGLLSPAETNTPFNSDITTSDLFPGTAPSGAEPNHRLTFMVGFWTRRVPDRMKEQKLYGPCGMLPPASEEHTWVHQISEGYEGKNDWKSEGQGSVTALPVPTISPAWEALPAVSEEVIALPPRGIDHRFFVKDPPKCFYDSLFEPDEFDSINGDDGEGV